MEQNDPYTVADALRVAADKAASLLEQLDEQNTSMRSASLGVLPDGTPVEAVLQELKELKRDHEKLYLLISAINYEAKRPASDRVLAMNRIRDALAKHKLHST